MVGKEAAAMKKVKIFFGKAQEGALEFLENRIEEWIEKENIEVKQVRQSYGEVPAKAGHEPALFISVWY